MKILIRLSSFLDGWSLCISFPCHLCHVRFRNYSFGSSVDFSLWCIVLIRPRVIVVYGIFCDCNDEFLRFFLAAGFSIIMMARQRMVARWIVACISILDHCVDYCVLSRRMHFCDTSSIFSTSVLCDFDPQKFGFLPLASLLSSPTISCRQTTVILELITVSFSVDTVPWITCITQLCTHLGSSTSQLICTGSRGQRCYLLRLHPLLIRSRNTLDWYI